MRPKLKFTVTAGDQVIFTEEGLSSHFATTEFLREKLHTAVEFEVSVDTTPLVTRTASRSNTAAQDALGKWLKENLVVAPLTKDIPWNVKPGAKGKTSVAFLTVTWECTGYGRAPARPKHIIAAEKAKRAAKSQARQQRRAEWQAEADQRTLNIRDRIKKQVDHAFATGKSGTEPASKYITCQECDGPAAVVCLNQPLAPGAMALDEDTIVGALCTAHIQHQPWGYYSRYAGKDVHKVPCAKLEFFYDGVRQIAIKPEPVNVMPTRDQMDGYRAKIAVFTMKLPARPGLGSVQRMRAFITKTFNAPPQNLTVAQWEQVITWFDDFAARHGLAGVIAHINNALGDMP